MKVLHLPSNVAGNAFGLAQGERALGLKSKALSLGTSVYSFPSDMVVGTGKSAISKLYQRVKTFIDIRASYDVYHFNFGSSLFHHLDYGLNLADLPFYNRKAVKVVTYQGCDARQKFPTIERIERAGAGHAACFYEKCWDGVCNSGKRDQRRRDAIDRMMSYCQHAFALNPDLLYFLPRDKSSFLPYTIPNFELIPEKNGPFFNNDKIHIVHAPTQRVTKGTEFILKAIHQLQESYPNKISFQMVENVPYAEAIKIYKSADLVIDQVLIGWYGGVAVEVMKMGIPVAAYINEVDLDLIPKDFVHDLPIIRISLETIVDVLSDLIENREILPEIGAQSLNFVNQWHHPNYVASLTRNIYLSCDLK